MGFEAAGPTAMTVLTTPTEEPTNHTAARAGVYTIIALLLALCVGGWFAYRQWFAGPVESAEFDVGPIRDQYSRVFRANAAPPQPRAELKDGINPAGVGFFLVKSGEFRMTLAQKESNIAPMQVICTR